MKTIKEHKAQLGGLPGIVATLVVIGILIAAGFFIIQTFLEEDEFADTSGSVVNESGLSIINSSGSTVARATAASGFNNFAVSECSGNVTGTNTGTPIVENGSITTGNYTVDKVAGTLTGVGASNYTDVACSYTYLYGETAYDSVNDTLTAMSTIPDLLGLIILIAIIGIILAVIFNVIPGSRVSGA